MKHLALLGSGLHLLQVAGHLQASGFAVTLLPEATRDVDQHGFSGTRSMPSLALVGADGEEELQRMAATAEGHRLPWLFLCGGSPTTDDGELTTVAYRAGALAVLPVGAPAELVVQAAGRAIESLALGGRFADNPPRRLHYRAGDTIDLRADEMLRITEGVVAQVVWHEDGNEGLVGLWGTGHLLSGHPEDACCLALRAQSDVWVEIEPLSAAGDAFERLLERTRRLEAWSSVQSRQSMEQRLLGVLGLLAEQFGTPVAEGTLIDVRITHAQLAAAIGAGRATVTRLLGPLRRRNQVQTVTVDEGERLCLPNRTPRPNRTPASLSRA